MMDSLHFTSQGNDQFFKMRIEDLEKQLDDRNSRIDNLCKELKLRSDELARQEEKHRSVCEARDESKFRVVQLEREMKVLRTENGNLKYQLKEQKEVKNSRDLTLEALVASYADQIKKCEEKLKERDSKIAELETVKNANSFSSERSFEKTSFVSNNEESCKLLQLENDIKLLSLENEDLKSQLGGEKERKNSRIETLEIHLKSYEVKFQKYEETIKKYEFKINELEEEKKEMACRSEKHIDEVMDLQSQLANYEACKKIMEVEKNTNIQLQKRLENLKSLCKEQILTETLEATKIMPDTRPGVKGVSELQECESILLSFVEQQRNLHVKFEQEMKNRLQHVQESILMTKKVYEVPKEADPQDNTADQGLILNPQDTELQKLEKAQELQVKLVKEDLCKCTPLKPQNKRHQKTVKTQVKEYDSQKSVTSNAASAVPQKKNTRKNKKIKDENEYPPTNQKSPGSVNIKNTVESLSSNQNQGRQLRTRRKV